MWSEDLRKKMFGHNNLTKKKNKLACVHLASYTENREAGNKQLLVTINVAFCYYDPKSCSPVNMYNQVALSYL